MSCKKTIIWIKLHFKCKMHIYFICYSRNIYWRLRCFFFPVYSETHQQVSTELEAWHKRGSSQPVCLVLIFTTLFSVFFLTINLLSLQMFLLKIKTLYLSTYCLFSLICTLIQCRVLLYPLPNLPVLFGDDLDNIPFTIRL